MSRGIILSTNRKLSPSKSQARPWQLAEVFLQEQELQEVCSTAPKCVQIPRHGGLVVAGMRVSDLRSTEHRVIFWEHVWVLLFNYFQVTEHL